ncbi:hypothetical protein [Pelagibacterium limicola]|uniref:hypothetical protein n=1 Tax=Pelagibacterium limicola TaxID=2791022 RepID=UPI0018AF8FEA|nr:hypothetical protein [Pelagibacterium limicola]
MTDIVKDWRFWLAGVLSWLIPFAAAIPFFTATGELAIAQPLFKSIMVIVGGLSGVVLLVWMFRRHRPDLVAALVIGLVWMVINLVLDMVVLVPMSGATIGDWYADIGLRYWMLPIIAAGMGAVAANNSVRAL